MCHSMVDLARCYKTAVFYIYICCFSISVHSWDTTTSALRKQTDDIWKFYFRFRFWTFYGHWYVILRRHNKFYPNCTIINRYMTSCRFSKMADIMVAIPKDGGLDTLWPYRRKSTSGCWKQTSTIFKFYSRFAFWPLRRHRYMILHRPTKF